VFALCGEELGPGNDFGMLLEQRPTLTLGHPAPNPELHPVVQCVGAAFGDDRTVPANHRGFPLRRTADEEFIRISGATSGLGYPGDPGFRRRVD
jgi:hypothetical protein